MDLATAARVVDAQVGPILSSAGFADATLGLDEDRMQILYCADLQMVVRRLPGLPDGHDGQAPPGACFDVMVELRADRVIDVNMDGGSLDAALDLFEMADLAARLRAALGSAASIVAPVVAQGLQALFVDLPERISSGRD